jgi:hypothetical protein
MKCQVPKEEVPSDEVPSAKGMQRERQAAGAAVEMMKEGLMG